MKHRARFWSWPVVLLVAVLAGCGQGEDESAGTLGVLLTAEVNEFQYRLSDATFQVTGTASVQITPAENLDAPSVQRVLPQGSYQIDLLEGWVLEKRSTLPGSVFQTIPAQLVSPDPLSFAITPGQTTQVTYAFATDGGVIGMGEGALDVTISVNDSSNPAGVAALALGAEHTCALLGDGRVRCWGWNSAGQLGYGHTENIGDNETPAGAGDVPLGGTATAITAGFDFTCALMTTGTVRCWGNNQWGQLGNGNTLPVANAANALEVPLDAAVTSITAGDAHICAMLASGLVRCWGNNELGQLGLGHTFNLGDDEPVLAADPVVINGTVSQLSAGAFHTCVRRTDPLSVRCWGFGQFGRLGYANTLTIGDDEVPAEAGSVDVGLSVSEVKAGGWHTCATVSTGAVRCWGHGSRLGYGNTFDIGDDEPPSAAGDIDLGGLPTALTAGFEHNCALFSTGVARCWGQNADGQLGYGHTTAVGTTGPPSAAGNVNAGGPIARIVAGGFHTCAIMAGSGAVRCWGRGVNGAIGYGNPESIGDNESPASAGDVQVLSATGGGGGTSSLAVTIVGNGFVTSLPDGIACDVPGSACEADFAPDTPVQLTATPGVGVTFAGWSGACSGTAPVVEVLVTGPTNCTATFNSAGGGATTPTFVSAGTGVALLGVGDLNVPFPAGIAGGQLLIVQIGQRQGNTPMTPAGWDLLFFDENPNSSVRQRLYFKVADDSDVGAAPVAIVTGSTGSTHVNTGRMYAFAGVDLDDPAAFTESAVIVLDENASLPGPTVTASGPGRLAVCFVAIDHNPVLAPFVGETGGDWTEAVAEFTTDLGSNFGLQLQVAPLATGGTISGGLADFGGLDNSSLCRAFALIGQ